MPNRPATHQPHFAKSSEHRERDRQRERDALRPTSAGRGYDAEWRALRKAFLIANPSCSAPGCGAPSVDADHVESLRDNPSRRLDASNLRPFCHAHHAQRTAREQGFGRTGEERGNRVSTRGASHPDWLRPSRVPLQIVCGPPAAGKRTFIARRMMIGETLIDLDAIRADIIGRPAHAPWLDGHDGLDAALRQRNRMLGDLALRTAVVPAWLVVGEPKAEWRRWWMQRLRPLAVFVIATPADVCHARIDASVHRAHVASLHHRLVDAWWRDYLPTVGERAIAGGGHAAQRKVD